MGAGFRKQKIVVDLLLAAAQNFNFSTGMLIYGQMGKLKKYCHVPLAESFRFPQF